MNPHPRLAFTPGEPAGIGPDLCVLMAQQPWPAEIVAFADPRVLARRAARLALPLRIRPFDPGDAPRGCHPGELLVSAIPSKVPVEAGKLDPANAPYVLETLRTATEGCLKGRFAALVTGPVHKGIINEAGIPFSGHTELLAEIAGGTPVMMLVAPGLRVALATTHLPLAQVSAAITKASLEQVLRVLEHDLRRRFGIAKPRILVCGLNPHAGEGGHLGREEIEIIEPVVAHLRGQGMDLAGPFAADTLFTPKYLRGTDAVLAMYHDQGLPVLKHMGFGRAVNITLGLPILRTSVDHGTALELAGTGRVDLGSLQAAVEAAIELSRR